MWVFVQTLNGHDGEELVEGPGVGHRLEEGEVAEIFVGHHLVELTQLVGHVLLMVGQFGNLARDAPIEALNLGAGAEVDDAVAEEVEGLVANVLGVVPVFQHGAR